MDRKESLIRVATRSYYDSQKLRIQTGNRIVASFRDKLGIMPSQAEEDVPEGKNILDALRSEYKLITTGVKRITKKWQPTSNLLTSNAEFRLIESYDMMHSTELAQLKSIEAELESYPIYTQWLVNVRGVGPTMAAVIISEIDIHKCNSISALQKYCGLDVVVSEKDGEKIEEGRSRKAGHLVEKTYTNRDGEETLTKGISFNPFLKTKMVGVLGSSFIKLGGDYREVYDGYKNRLEHHPKHKDKTKGHRHSMAVRFMVKEFLADLFTVWRTLEGLEVRPSYAEGKLGIVHSKPKRIQDFLDRNNQKQETS
jgi:hypothetical protein